MAIIKGVKSTTIWKAFFLNSLASSIIIVLAITVQGYLDKIFIKNKDDKDTDNKLSFKSIALTFIITFITTYFVYTLLYFIFGFGGGFLVKD